MLLLARAVRYMIAGDLVGVRGCTMKIYKTMVSISDDPETVGTIFKMDTIEHEGRMWLVPEWLDMPGKGLSKPARLICLDVLEHEKSSGDQWDYVLTHPIPKSVCDGRIPKEVEHKYVVIERPNIEVPRTH